MIHPNVLVRVTEHILLTVETIGKEVVAAFAEDDASAVPGQQKKERLSQIEVALLRLCGIVYHFKDVFFLLKPHLILHGMR